MDGKSKREAREPESLTDEEIADALAALANHVAVALPKRYYPSELARAPWRMISAAQVARIGELARSMAVLLRAGQSLDVATLSRVLYEHVVIFCWIQAAPEERMPLWVAASDRDQAALSSDMDAYGGGPAVPEGELVLYRKGKRLNLDQLASEVDRHWSARLPAFRPWSEEPAGVNLLTLRGMYTAVYRLASRHVHGQIRALDPFLRQEREGRVVIASTGVAPRTELCLIVPLATMAIVVSGATLGWPDPQVASEINNRLIFERTDDEAP